MSDQEATSQTPAAKTAGVDRLPFRPQRSSMAVSCLIPKTACAHVYVPLAEPKGQAGENYGLLHYLQYQPVKSRFLGSSCPNQPYTTIGAVPPLCIFCVRTHLTEEARARPKYDVSEQSQTVRHGENSAIFKSLAGGDT